MIKLACFAFVVITASAQEFSRQFLSARPYPAEDDARILKLFEGIRVADTIDALDAIGLQEVTMMDRRSGRCGATRKK